MYLKLTLILFTLHLLFNNIRSQCWIGSYGRGAGRVLHTCQNGYEKDGALCYPNCDQGYNGVGPVCWGSCQSGYTNTGLTCFRPTHIYGKGCCCFFNGCCKNCPSGYNDDGCTCHRYPHSYSRPSYGRGAGKPLGCSSNEEKDGALCYPLCENGYNGRGPVCWYEECKGAMPYKCGLMCTVDKDQCKSVVKDFALTGFDLISDLIFRGVANPLNFLTLFTASVDISYQLINDVCDGSNNLPSYCIKTIQNNTKLSSCSGQNSFDCGLFCASSKIQCAKQTVKLVSTTLTLINSVTSLDFIGVRKETYNTAKLFVIQFPNIITILKSNVALSLDLEKSKSLVLGLMSIFELADNALSKSC